MLLLSQLLFLGTAKFVWCLDSLMMSGIQDFGRAVQTEGTAHGALEHEGIEAE